MSVKQTKVPQKSVASYLIGLSQYITTFSTSDVNAKTMNPVPLDAGKDIAAIVMAGSQTFTGTPTAGKGFKDLLQDLSIGQGADKPLEIKAGCLGHAVQLLNDGTLDGVFQDPALETGTAKDVVAVLYGPFKTRHMTDPRLFLSTKDASALGTATGYSATIDIGIIYADAPVQRGKYLTCDVRATAATRHEFNNVGPMGGMLRRALLVGGTASYLSNVEMTAVNGQKPISMRYHKLLQACYCAWADLSVATAGAKFLVEGLNAPYYSGRQFVVEHSTADTMTAIFENWV